MKNGLARFRRLFFPEIAIQIHENAPSPAAVQPSFGDVSSGEGSSPAESSSNISPVDILENSTPVASLQEGLRQLNISTADVFLELGTSLQSIVTQARELAELSKSAAKLGTEASSASPLQTLQQALADASQMHASGQMSQKKLHQVLSCLHQCQTPMARLMKLPFLLGAVGMLSRIEASRLESSTINVSSLTADMGGLSEEIGKQVMAVGDEADRLSLLIKEGTAHLDEVEQQQNNQAEELIRQTNAVLTSFRARQEDASRAALTIDERYGAVRHAADKIVMSLQCEDIARQRIEHVQEALSHIAEATSAEMLDSSHMRVLVLQRSQLLSTRDFLSESITAFRRELHSLNSTLTALTSETSTLSSQIDEEGHSFSTEVTNKLDTLCAIFAQYFATARVVETTVDSVLPGVAQMARAIAEVEEIQSSISLMALNAEIKTGHLGKHGAAIGALATKLRAITVQSDRDTTAVLTSLHATQSFLDEMAAQKVTSSASLAHHDADTMKEQVGALIDSVVTASQGLPNMLSLLFEKAAHMRTELDEAAAVAERANLVTQIFEDVLDRLDRALSDMGHAPGVVISSDGATAALSALYSMQSERDIHEKVLGVNVDGPATGELQPPQGDLGSDIELF